MSRGVNKWHGIGNCCGDPEARYMPNGSAVTNITIACNDSYKDKNSGQMVDRAEFVRIVFFGRLAEIAGEYLKKGAPVYIEGSLRTRKWQDNSGQDRYTTEIVASEMQMLGGSGGNGGDRAAQQYADYQQQGGGSAQVPAPSQQQPQQGAPSGRMNENGTKTSPHASPPPAAMDDFDDDIPFADPYKHIGYMV